MSNFFRSFHIAGDSSTVANSVTIFLNLPERMYDYIEPYVLDNIDIIKDIFLREGMLPDEIGTINVSIIPKKEDGTFEIRKEGIVFVENREMTYAPQMLSQRGYAILISVPGTEKRIIGKVAGGIYVMPIGIIAGYQRGINELDPIIYPALLGVGREVIFEEFVEGITYEQLFSKCRSRHERGKLVQEFISVWLRLWKINNGKISLDAKLDHVKKTNDGPRIVHIGEPQDITEFGLVWHLWNSFREREYIDIFVRAIIDCFGKDAGQFIKRAIAHVLSTNTEEIEGYIMRNAIGELRTELRKDRGGRLPYEGEIRYEDLIDILLRAIIWSDQSGRTGSETGPDPTSQIGKKIIIQSVIVDDKNNKILLRVTDKDGNPIPDIILDISSKAPPIGEQRQAIVDTARGDYRKLVSDIISECPSNIQPYIFSNLIGDLFGFARPEHTLIALYESLERNPIAIFHEIGEYLIKVKRLELGMPDKNTLIISIGDGEPIEINVSEVLVGLSEDKKYWEEGWQGNPHYLLRVLQRQLFGGEDKKLTERIKAIINGHASPDWESAAVKEVRQLIRDIEEEVVEFKKLTEEDKSALEERILCILRKARDGEGIDGASDLSVVLDTDIIPLERKFEVVSKIAKLVNKTVPDEKKVQRGEVVAAIEGKIVDAIREAGEWRDIAEESLLQTAKGIGEKKGIPLQEVQSIFDLFRNGMEILTMDPDLDPGQIDGSYFALIGQISVLVGLSEVAIRKAFTEQYLDGRYFKITDGKKIRGTKLYKAAKRLAVYNELYKDTQELAGTIPGDIEKKSKGDVVVFHINMFKDMPLVGLKTVLRCIKDGGNVRLGLRVPSDWDRGRVEEWLSADWELRDMVILLDEDIEKAKDDSQLEGKNIVFVEDERYEKPDELRDIKIFGVSRDSSFYAVFLFGIMYARADDAGELCGFLKVLNISQDVIGKMNKREFFTIKLIRTKEVLDEFQNRRIYIDMAA